VGEPSGPSISKLGLCSRVGLAMLLQIIGGHPPLSSDVPAKLAVGNSIVIISSIADVKLIILCFAFIVKSPELHIETFKVNCRWNALCFEFAALRATTSLLNPAIPLILRKPTSRHHLCR
jgi:hypothetical protein